MKPYQESSLTAMRGRIKLQGEKVQRQDIKIFKAAQKNASKFGNLRSGHRTEKVSFHSNPKECSNFHTIALISHASQLMLKILQARLQQFVNCELPDVQAGFRKSRGTRDQIANIR